MPRTDWKEEVDYLSKDLSLPLEILDRRTEKASRIGEYLVAALILVSLVWVGGLLFMAGPNQTSSTVGASDSVQRLN